MVRSAAKPRVSNTQVGLARLVHQYCRSRVNPRSVAAESAALVLRDAALRAAPQDEGGAGGAMDAAGRAHQNPRGKSLPNFARISSSSSLLDRASIGKVSRRDHGRQASITTRALRGSSGL